MGLLDSLRGIGTSKPPTRELDFHPSLLIVDDLPINCVVLRQFFKLTPFEVDEAQNGAIAVAKVKLRRYDFIMMDLLMPEMDGFEAMREIRCWEDSQGSAPACIIITLTAWDLEEAVTASIQSGADAHLTKPITREKLFGAINKQWSRFVKQPAIIAV